MDNRMSRRYKRCVICGIRRLPNTNVFLSSFPLDPDRCRQWVKASGVEDLVHIPIEKLHELKYICGAHFTRECFNEKGNRLRKHSVPTLELPSPLADNLFSEFPLHVRSYYEKNEKSYKDQTLNAITPSEQAIISSAHTPVASSSNAPMHLTYTSKNDESIPFNTTNPKICSVGYTPIASTSKAPMHLTYKRNSEEDDTIVIQSYKRRKLVAEKHGAEDKITKREKKILEKLKDSRITVQKLLKTSIDLDKLDSETLKNMIQDAVKNQRRQPHAKRWNLKSKISALAIFKRSPKAYRYMQNMLPLPSTRTLQRILKEIPVEPGVHIQIIKLLKERGENLENNEKYCVLLFDEMALKKRLIYNESSDLVEGFVDLGGVGSMGRQNKIAGHALVFMIQGLKIKFKQPISHYFVEGTIETEKLSVIIKENINLIRDAGFTVLATVCDQGPTNIGALNFLKKSSNLSLEENYFIAGGHKIFIIYDVPHLFKSIRNNFFQAGIMTFNGRTAKWSHLIEAEERNRNFLNFQKITSTVVNPTYKVKMRVKYAAHALSNTMKAVLKTMAVAWNKDREEELFQTAHIVGEMDKLFDVTNGPASPNDRKAGIRENVSKHTKHIESWNYYLKYIDTLKFLKSDSKLQLKNVRCIKGFKITLNSFKDIWRFLSNEGSYKYLNLRQLNQDSLENLFGTIRQHSVTNRNPTCSHFNAALKSSIVSGLTGPHSRGSNCLLDTNKVLVTYKEILKNKREVEHGEEHINDDCYPVLSLPEEPELEEMENYLYQFEEQPTVYVSGYLAAKILKKYDCESCRQSLIESDPNLSDPMYRYIRLKEWWPDKTSLTYPKKELCKMISEAKNIYELEVACNLHQPNIRQWYSLQLSTKLRTQWLVCEAHSTQVKEFLYMFVSKLFIRKSCKIINKSFETSESEIADKVKKAQQANKDK